MKPYPMRLVPLLKPKVWGGRALAQLGKSLPAGALIGESWELADLPASIPEGRSVIANGELTGQTLRNAIQSHSKAIMGAARLSEEGGFPLLIKYLDARENLSVQVHPDREYAARHPGSHLKSEAWIVIHAEPGAVIYKGVRSHVTPAEFAAHIRANIVVDDLIAVPATVGDCHYLPSGTCHALGAGILVAEIQTPSDTTFRVYDWGRTGTGRELHIEQALECIQFGKTDVPRQTPPPYEVEWIRTTHLVETEYFAIERIDARAGSSFHIVTSDQPEVWMLIDGAAAIDMPESSQVAFNAGETLLIPAALAGSHVRFSRDSWMIRTTLPSPLKGMIA